MNFKLVFFSLLLLSGCATPYQKLGKRGGYSDEKINEHVYRVQFQGNTHSKDELVYKYFLKRSAELTLEKGYNYFIIVNTEDKSKTAVVSQEGTAQTRKPVTTVAYSGDVDFIPTEYKNISKHIIEGKIALFKEGEEPIDAFKAQDVLKSIRK
jgi:hypothetical protein